MPIKHKAAWKRWLKVNCELHGLPCVQVARKVMELLDAEAGDFSARDLIARADDEIGNGIAKCRRVAAKGYRYCIFMAPTAVRIVAEYHSRGEEFCEVWNREVDLAAQAEEAAKARLRLNPALLHVQAA